MPTRNATIISSAASHGLPAIECPLMQTPAIVVIQIVTILVISQETSTNLCQLSLSSFLIPRPPAFPARSHRPGRVIGDHGRSERSRTRREQCQGYEFFPLPSVRRSQLKSRGQCVRRIPDTTRCSGLLQILSNSLLLRTLTHDLWQLTYDLLARRQTLRVEDSRPFALRSFQRGPLSSPGTNLCPGFTTRSANCFLQPLSFALAISASRRVLVEPPRLE